MNFAFLSDVLKASKLVPDTFKLIGVLIMIIVALTKTTVDASAGRFLCAKRLYALVYLIFTGRGVVSPCTELIRKYNSRASGAYVWPGASAPSPSMAHGTLAV